jgi:hypothetical protein
MLRPRRIVLLTWVALLGALASCHSNGSGEPSGSAPTASSAEHHVATVYQVTHKSHRGVIRLDVGDSFEVPDEATSTYRVDLSDPSLFRADTATHYTAITSGPSRLLVWVDPICHEADAAACGRSKERWSVQLLVR